MVRQITGGSYNKHFVSLGFSEVKILQFVAALTRSGKQSVDAFLEHRPEYLEIGKTAIALALIPFETENRLFNRKNGLHWYDYLFGKMNARFEEFAKNAVSFLTFNYDRSLEYYLFCALQNSYGKSPEEVAKAVKSLRLIHLHGQLGFLPGLAKNGRNYEPHIDPESVRQAAKGIKVIHEGAGREPQFTQAKRILKNAQRVFFLGFGYDPINLKRLGVPTILTGKRVYGSGFGLTQTEADRIQTKFLIQVDPIGREVLEFLRWSEQLDD